MAPVRLALATPQPAELPSAVPKSGIVSKEKRPRRSRTWPPLGKSGPQCKRLGKGVQVTNTHIPSTRSLTEVLDRARLAVIGAQSPTTTLAPTIRPTEPPRPAVRLSNPTPAPAIPLRPTCVPLSTLADLDELHPGPRRLLELLYQVARSTVTARAYPVVPSQVTIHQPQELIARALGCHLVTVWRWAQELVTAGLIAARGHYTSSKGSTRIDGTLYAVSLQAGHRAHLTHDDLAHQWRDLDADREAGRTAWKALQGSDPIDRGAWFQMLQNWAVTPGSTNDDPLVPDHCRLPGTLQDAAYALPLLASAHPDKRPALVGMLASALAHALEDQHSRRFWCKVIWNAWTDETEGRAGLQVLAAQLARLDADRREWPGLKRPGALLVSRLRMM